MGTVFAGQVTEVSSDVKGPDRIITLEVQDAASAYYNQRISKTYQAGTLASYIIGDILALSGLTLGTIDISTDLVYKNGYTANGRFRDVLKKVVRDIGHDLLLSKQTINIIPQQQGFTTGYVLSGDNGLLSINKIEDPQRQAEYIVKSILNHDINIRSILQIESKDFNGLVMVLSGKHTTNYETIMEVVTIGSN